MTIESLLKINNLKTDPSNIIKKLEDISEQDLYRSTLKVQMDLYLSEILRYLFNHQIWSSAKTVIDLGCGPGDLISNIARYYPDKFYTGVDINEPFIKIAKEQNKAQNNCEFVCADLYEFAKGQYDIVILRAVLQHLNDPDRFMKRLPDLLHNNSVVLLNDTPNENFIESSPSIPAFDDFYKKLQVSQRDKGGNRNCLKELEDNLERYNFKLIEAYDQTIPITTEENRLKIIQYLILGCSIATKMFSIHVDLKSLFGDLVKWYESEASYIQIKTKWMMIKIPVTLV